MVIPTVPNVLINLRILAIVPNYMSVFAHQKPIYLLPSVNIPGEGSDYHTFVQNTLIFLLNLRKFWLRLIVEVNGQSQLIRDGYSVTIQLQDNEYPVTTFCN